MATITNSNGYVSNWDETITVGTLITAYHSGYFILERIDHRDQDDGEPDFERQAPVFHYVKVVSTSGLPSAKVRQCCDASFCARVTKETIASILAVETGMALEKHNELLKYL